METVVAEAEMRIDDLSQGGMKMRRVYSLEELKDSLRPIFLEYGIRDAVIFGSYAKGCATPYSDVDIYVDSQLRGLAFFGLLEDVTNAVSIPVDLVDRQCIIPGGPLLREIRETGVSVYDN